MTSPPANRLEPFTVPGGLRGSLDRLALPELLRELQRQLGGTFQPQNDAQPAMVTKNRPRAVNGKKGASPASIIALDSEEFGRY